MRSKEPLPERPLTKRVNNQPDCGIPKYCYLGEQFNLVFKETVVISVDASIVKGYTRSTIVR